MSTNRKKELVAFEEEEEETYIACAEGDVDKQKNELIAQEEDEEEEDVRSMR